MAHPFSEAWLAQTLSLQRRGMADHKQQLRYRRLWEGARPRSHEKNGSTPKARGKRKTGGVTSSRVGSSPVPCTAIARKGHLQECHGYSYRSASSAALSRKSDPTPSAVAPPPRSHSSLGFRELPRPQGFDLQEYVKRHGSANDIRIGINGVCSPDEYFERYLEECEAVAQCEKRLPSSSSIMNDVEELDLMERSSTVTSSPHPDLVPLCWDHQLKKAQVCTIP